MCQTKENNNHILGEAGVYLPADYAADLEGIPFKGCVHVEAFPTNQVQEAQWIEVNSRTVLPVSGVRAAAVEIASPTGHSPLQELGASGAAPVLAICANANLSMQPEGPNSK